MEICLLCNKIIYKTLQKFVKLSEPIFIRFMIDIFLLTKNFFLMS